MGFTFVCVGDWVGSSLISLLEIWLGWVGLEIWLYWRNS